MSTIADRLRNENHFNLLRMTAATAVLVSHAYPLTLGRGSPEPLSGILHGQTLGGVSVLVFFAISGFFIASSYTNHSNPLNFVRARALRILPALYVMLAATIALATMVKIDVTEATFWAAVPSYLFSQATLNLPAMFRLGSSVSELPGVFVSNPFPITINGSLWTLPYEVICYLGVLVCGALGLLRKRGAFTLVVLVCTAAYAARLVALEQGLRLPTIVNHLVSLGFPFVIGMAFFVWADRVVLSRWIAFALVAVAIAAWPTPIFPLAFVVALSYGVFLLGFTDMPSLARYNRFGDYSYGIYIYAFPIQQTLALSGVSDPTINILVAFPLTLACAFLSWHVVEKPFLRFKTKGRGVQSNRAQRK